ncbi:hypothetical protein WMY93_025748 [Mugilogobius chulae]|uniref:Protein kinase domain-containing protein n=1 Tax=Mugilogobius chulae TaxID=88201 RepID=A0AAW0MVI9_9GOBI
MAVDLTPRFRRLNSQTRSFREHVLQVQQGYSGPFGATQLWNNIIHALKTQVEVRRYRRHLRVHAECFMGSDAVDAVLSYLMQNVMFCTSEVSRLKAARLCQALMEANVFEPVGTKLFRKAKDVSFEDSTSSLYRFIGPGTRVDTDSENVQPKELETKWKGYSPFEKRTISNPIATGPFERKIHRLLKNMNIQLPISPSQSISSKPTPLLSKAVVEEVWKQQTLFHLLQIIEVPVLDSILSSPARVQRQSSLAPLYKQDVVISNTCLERELTDTLNLPLLDEWLSAAADLLELFPDQLIVVAGEQLSQFHGDALTGHKEQLTNQKRLLFELISKYYSGQEKNAFLSGRYLDIHIAILQLIRDEKLEDAFKATQLCLQLLDTSKRDELKRLLTFMAAATSPEACCLQKQTDNRTLVCRAFQKAIVQNYKLCQSQIETLVLFLMSNHHELFKTPKTLIEGVRGTLRKMQQGEDPDTIPTFTFCQQMTPEEYQDQCEAATLENLKLLLDNISMNKEMPDDSNIYWDKLDFKMESMLNKLKSTVTKVTADVTSAVMGNPVTREFEVGKHIASGGPCMCWRIYNGTKKSTKQEVAVFVFDKKVVDKYQKFEKDQIIDSLKKGVQQLTRLRHPRLLTVQHPLEESRDCLAFCTEPVFASLANVLGQWDNLPSPVPNDIKEYKLFDVETKYGLLQISEGLAFLHSGVKMVHGNLSPENIILNKSGAWKIMGFDFSISSNNPSDAEPKYTCKEWEPNLPPLCLPNPEYLAPEYILSVSCDSASDMYSLGVVMHAVFNEGKPVFQVNKHDIFKSFSRQLDQLTNISPTLLNKMPEEVRDHVKMLLSVTPTVRPDADQMTKIPFFDDVGAVTLQYFDSLFQRDNLQKSQFYKGLPKVLPKLPKRVVVYRILPALTSEFVNPDMVPFVLPNVLLIAEECTKEEYIRLILPDLTPVFKQQEPIQILLIFLQKMDLLLTKTPPDDIKNSVLPMVYRALEAPSVQIQELCLNIIPTFANLIDYPSMKNSLIPKIKSACLQTSSLAVRVNSLVCLGKILEYLDKWFVIDEVLPFLQQIPSREPAVLMGVLGIYKCTFSHKKLGIPKEHLATKSLPHLVSLSIDNNLNLNQFNSFMMVIRDMLSRMEAEHKTKLEQLHVMQEQTRSLNISNQGNQVEETKSPPNSRHQIDDIFGSAAVNGKEHGSSAPAPNRMSLTLEEKQRLAKEQEQAAKLRSQQPLAPQTVKPASTSSSQTKDLTSSLLNNMTSLNSMSLANTPRPGPVQGSTMSTFPAPNPMVGSMGAAISNGFNTSMGFQAGGMGMGMQPQGPGLYGGMATTTSTPNFVALTQNQGQMGQANKAPDMSALDNLFTSNKPKVSLNQMGPKPGPASTNSSPWSNQFTAGHNTSMQAAPAGMGSFGMQANPFFSPQNFSQPAVSSGVNQSAIKQSTSVNNDLKDLFG